MVDKNKDIAQVRALHQKYNDLMKAGDDKGAHKAVDEAFKIILADPAAIVGAE